MHQGEVNPFNQGAIRGAGGIWNEATLPILEWEDPFYRVVVPAYLQKVMGVSETVLRWARTKREVVLRTHPRDSEIINNLNVFLPQWTYAGKEQGSSDVWRVLFEAKARWYATTIGRDENGSLNLVTIFGSQRRGFARNRLENLKDVEERKR